MLIFPFPVKGDKCVIFLFRWKVINACFSFSVCNKRSMIMITPEAWTPVIINIYIYIYFLNLNSINFGQRSTLRGAVTIMIYSSKISIHRFIAGLRPLCYVLPEKSLRLILHSPNPFSLLLRGVLWSLLSYDND